MLITTSYDLDGIGHRLFYLHVDVFFCIVYLGFLIWHGLFLCICILVFLYCISWFSCILQGLTLTTSPAPLAITTVMARCTAVRQATSAQGPPLVYILREHDLYKSQTSSPTGSRLTSNIKIIIKKKTVNRIIHSE